MNDRVKDVLAGVGALAITAGAVQLCGSLVSSIRAKRKTAQLEEYPPRHTSLAQFSLFSSPLRVAVAPEAVPP
jgi:hypothetical protein